MNVCTKWAFHLELLTKKNDWTEKSKLCYQMGLDKITSKWMLNLCLFRWKINQNESNYWYHLLVQLLEIHTTGFCLIYIILGTPGIHWSAYISFMQQTVQRTDQLLSWWRSWVTFYEHTLIPAWVTNYIHYKVWDETSYLNFNCAAIEVWSHFIPHLTWRVITYPLVCHVTDSWVKQTWGVCHWHASYTLQIVALTHRGWWDAYMRQ